MQKNRYEILQFIICSVIDVSSQAMDYFSRKSFEFRSFEHFLFALFLSIWIFAPSTCWSCPTVDDRQDSILGSLAGKFILVYACLGVFIHPCLFGKFWNHLSAWKSEEAQIEMKGVGVSTERNLEIMLRQNDIEGIDEMICFGDDSFLRNDRKEKSILHVLCESFESHKGTEKEDGLLHVCVSMVKNGYDVQTEHFLLNKRNIFLAT